MPFTHPELAAEWDDPLDVFSVSFGSNVNVLWKCNNCSHRWKAIVNNRSHGRGCPKCKRESKPERAIREIVEAHKVEFVSEYRIPNCRDRRPLPFDFALFRNDKLIGLIEYQGRHHFEPIFGPDRFALIQKHDQIKREFSAKIKVPLLEIESPDEIPVALEKFLQKIMT